MLIYVNKMNALKLYHYTQFISHFVYISDILDMVMMCRDEFDNDRRIITINELLIKLKIISFNNTSLLLPLSHVTEL